MTKSARLRRSASGSCCAQDPAQLLGRHPRPPQRALRLQHRARGDHGHRVDAALAAGLEQQRDVEHARAGRRRGRPGAGNGPRLARTSGWTIASSRRSAGGSAEHPPAERAAVDPAVGPRQPGKAAATGATAAPPGAAARAPRRRHRTPARRRRGTRSAARLLPMAIEPVRPEHDHAASTPWSRRNCSSGRSGRPSTVEWSPSTRAISWAPRPSSW